jgi:hypothetical protein
MKRRKPRRIPQADPAVEANTVRLIEAGARVRLPALFDADRPDVMYHVPERSGVTLTALPTTALREGELEGLMKFRLGQYLEVNFVDPVMVFETGMDHEPLSAVGPGDVHVVAGAPTGEVLCYGVMKGPPPVPEGTLMRDRDRPLFPVEKVHGWGIFNRLRILPDLPVSRVRELGRFVKNQRFKTFSDEGVRGPVEVCTAMFKVGSGPLAGEYDAYVGDFEEAIAKQNMDFFHVPLVVLHGTVPYEGETAYLYPRYQYRTVYPFASLVSDSEAAMPRLAAIDRALSRPGKRGILALMRMKGDPSPFRSSLEPPGGLPSLAEAVVPQKGVAMSARYEMIREGEHLRSTEPFGSLSPPEAAVLRSFMERIDVEQGSTVVRQGEPGDALYLIESGQAEVRVDGHAIAELGPGQHFGEISLLTGGERIADVVAATRLGLLRLGRHDFERYLAHLVGVEESMARTASQRAEETARARNPG